MSVDKLSRRHDVRKRLGAIVIDPTSRGMFDDSEFEVIFRSKLI